MLFLVICMSAFLTAESCGVIPVGQERTLNFNVSDFKLPAIMAYSEGAMGSMISTSKNGAETFVKQLIMRSVTDVLYQQGRSAFLPDNVITAILQQLDVQILYDPLKCDTVINAAGDGAMMGKQNCLVVESTVIDICDKDMAGCMLPGMIGNHKPIDSKHLSISGSLKTSNVIMANWSNQMWQSVFNRVLREIARSSQVGSYFIAASVTLQ